MLWKELRENFRWAFLGCVLMTLGLLVVAWTSSAFLLSEMRFKLIITWGAPAIGLLLGAAQAASRKDRNAPRTTPRQTPALDQARGRLWALDNGRPPLARQSRPGAVRLVVQLGPLLGQHVDRC